MLPARLPFAIDTRRVRSFDGTEIAYHVAGAGRRRGEGGADPPWIVLADGMGGGLPVWRGQIDYLRDRYRFLSWDYRALYASERPRPERADAYAVPIHVRDLEAVLAAERIDRAVFAGWSLGVQVLLEAFGGGGAGRLRGRARGSSSSTASGAAPWTASCGCPAARSRGGRRCPCSSSSGGPARSARGRTGPSGGARRRPG